jgi:hypothetical protein
MVSRALCGVVLVLALAGCGASKNGSDPGLSESPRTGTEAASPPASPSATQPVAPEKVFVATPAGSQLHRPTRIDLAEGGTDPYVIRDIRWTRYGGSTAVGTGVLHSTGHASEPVTIRFRAKELCEGKPTYLEVSVQHQGQPKHGFGQIMSPNTWASNC